MIPYYHSPFYSSLLLWRHRLRNSIGLLIAILLLHGRVPPPESIPDMWFWTGCVFGLVCAVCYVRMAMYERYILEACDYLNPHTIIGVSDFERLERRHAKWFRRKFKSEPSATNNWKI